MNTQATLPSIPEVTKLPAILPKGFKKLAISATLEGLQNHINSYCMCTPTRPKEIVPIHGRQGYYSVSHFGGGDTGLIVIQTTKRFYFGHF